MKRANHLPMPCRFALLLTLACIAATSQAANTPAPGPAVDLRLPPPSGNHPVMVTLGMYTRDLPRVGYGTFLDAVFLASFIFCFLAVFEITLVYLLQKHNRRPLAVRMHAAGRWAYPAAYSAVLLILALGFLAWSAGGLRRFAPFNGF